MIPYITEYYLASYISLFTTSYMTSYMTSYIITNINHFSFYLNCGPFNCRLKSIIEADHFLESYITEIAISLAGISTDLSLLYWYNCFGMSLSWTKTANEITVYRWKRLANQNRTQVKLVFITRTIREFLINFFFLFQFCLRLGEQSGWSSRSEKFHPLRELKINRLASHFLHSEHRDRVLI